MISRCSQFPAMLSHHPVSMQFYSQIDDTLSPKSFPDIELAQQVRLQKDSF